MYKIAEKRKLADKVTMLSVYAPDIARKAKAGQFVIVRCSEKGERIPLTIADFSNDEGTVTVIIQEVGKTTIELCALEEGGYISDVSGPMGNPTHVKKYGTVVCIGGGIGVACIYIIAKAMKEQENRVISIMGARNNSLLFWEEKIRTVSDEVVVTTDDGSYGKRGLVTDRLKEVSESNKIDFVISIGPAVMMKAVSERTGGYGIKSVASLNSIMIDGTGMCGSCRVAVDGKTKFACVDGPEFDAHKVDFDLLIRRGQVYREHEKEALHKCRIGLK